MNLPTQHSHPLVSTLGRLGALVAGALLTLPAACSSDGASFEELDVEGQEIRNGTETLEYGVVEIAFPNGSACTGAIINGHYMITAAHCLTDSGSLKKGSGTFDGIVRYFDPDNGAKRRITLSTGWETLRGHIFSTYNDSKDLDMESDFALVERIYRPASSSPLQRPALPWDDVTRSQDYLKLSLGNCDKIDRSDLFGRGYAGFSGEGSGTLRTMPINLKECHKNYFFDLAGSRQTCRGDSGGPYIVDSGGVRAVAGLLVGEENSVPLSEGSETDTQYNCASGGKPQYGTRMNDGKLGWIESIIGSKCTQSVVDGHRVAQCWTS